MSSDIRLLAVLVTRAIGALGIGVPFMLLVFQFLFVPFRRDCGGFLTWCSIKTGSSILWLFDLLGLDAERMSQTMTAPPQGIWNHIIQWLWNAELFIALPIASAPILIPALFVTVLWDDDV